MEKAACAIYIHAVADRKTYQTVYCNLDAIIGIGYRVKSQRGTQFPHLGDNFPLLQVVLDLCRNALQRFEVNFLPLALK